MYREISEKVIYSGGITTLLFKILQNVVTLEFKLNLASFYNV